MLSEPTLTEPVWTWPFAIASYLRNPPLHTIYQFETFFTITETISSSVTHETQIIRKKP
jgi:hypothetical protein